MRGLVTRLLFSIGVLFSLSNYAHASGINSDDGLALPIGAGGGGPTITVMPSAPGVAGNVGIGTTAPAGLLDVEGGGGIILNAGNVSTGTPTSSQELLNYNPFGQVSGGVDSALHVVNTTAASTQGSALVVTDNVNTSAIISFGDPATTVPPEIGSFGNSIVLSTAPTGLELGRFTIDQNGNGLFANSLGVATGSIPSGTPYLVVGNDGSAPPANAYAYFANNGGGYSLIAGGTLEAMSDINTQTSYLIGGACYAGACISDIRVKDHIRPFKPGLGALLALNPIYYRLNGLGGTVKSDRDALGVTTQDVEKGAPELVTPKKVVMHPGDKEEVEIKQVNYTGLQYVVINAVKELYGKWSDDHAALASDYQTLEANDDHLQSEIDELRNEVAGLRERASKN
jgi:hypothetical protein